MEEHVLAGNMLRMEFLAARIARLPWMIRSAEDQGTTPEEEAWRVVHGLADIEESVDRLFHELIWMILNSSYETSMEEETSITGILQEMREEYRHILYHIRDATPFGLE